MPNSALEIKKKKKSEQNIKFNMKVKDGVWLVTGGASGLGEGTVRHLSSLGGKVCIVFTY